MGSSRAALSQIMYRKIYVICMAPLIMYVTIQSDISLTCFPWLILFHNHQMTLSLFEGLVQDTVVRYSEAHLKRDFFLEFLVFAAVGKTSFVALDDKNPWC